MAAYQFRPVWRNSNTRRDLSVEEMQLYVNHVFHPCVAVVVGPSIIVQRNRTSTEIIGAPTNAALAQREVLEARLMDAKASNNFAAVRQLTEELAALGDTLEKKRVLRVHQDTYKHVIWLNKVCFEYVAESDQEVNEVKFELDLKAEIKLSISLQAKVCDVTPEPEPVPVKAASSSSRPPVVALPRYPAPFSFPLVHMDLKPGVPYHILAASKLGMRLSKKGTTNAIMLSEVSAADTCQLVSFVPQDDNNWLILSWTKPEHALDVQSAKMTGDARLHFWSKVHRKPNQLFKIVKCPEGRAFIQVQHSSLWIKHQKDQIVQGNPINDDQAFHWTILPATAAGSQAVGSTGLFSRVSGASCV